MRRAALATALVAVGVTAAASTAHAEDDVQLWTEAGLSADVAKRTTVTLDAGLRFDQDVSRLLGFLPELSVTQRLARWLRVGAGYRFEYERDRSGDLVVRHRFELAGRARLDLDPVRLEYRLQLQEAVRPSSNDQYRHTVRNRFDASYQDLGRWVPWASLELHHDLDRDGETFAYDKTWITAGLAVEQGRRELDVYYRAELPADPMEPTAHILGAGVHVDL